MMVQVIILIGIIIFGQLYGFTLDEKLSLDCHFLIHFSKLIIDSEFFSLESKLTFHYRWNYIQISLSRTVFIQFHTRQLVCALQENSTRINCKRIREIESNRSFTDLTNSILNTIAHHFG